MVINKKNNRGFTLLEMTVVIGVFAILIVGATEIFSAIYNVSNSASTTKDLTQEMRYAMDEIARESKNARELTPLPVTNDDGSIEIKTKDNQQITYSCENCGTENGRILKEIVDYTGTALADQYITSDNISILEFRLHSTKYATEDSGAGYAPNLPYVGSTIYSPHFEFRIKGESRVADSNGDKKVYTLRSLVTKEEYHEYTYSDLYSASEPGLFFLKQGSSTEMVDYKEADDSWGEIKTSVPVGASDGSAFITHGSEYYYVQGSQPSPTYFGSYDPSSNTWTSLTSPPWEGQFSLTSDMDNNRIWAMKVYDAGYPNSKFGYYDVAGNSWVDLSADLPIFMGWVEYSFAGPITYAGGEIHAFHVGLGGGGGGDNVAVYQVPLNNWIPEAYFMPFLVEPAHDGSSAISIGTDMYISQGYGFTGFAKVPVGGGLPVTLAGLDTIGLTKEAGSTMQASSDEAKIYLTQGNGSNRFAEYDIATNTWVEVANLPFVITNGGSGL